MAWVGVLVLYEFIFIVISQHGIIEGLYYTVFTV